MYRKSHAGYTKMKMTMILGKCLFKLILHYQSMPRRSIERRVLSSVVSVARRVRAIKKPGYQRPNEKPPRWSMRDRILSDPNYGCRTRQGCCRILFSRNPTRILSEFVGIRRNPCWIWSDFYGIPTNSDKIRVGFRLNRIRQQPHRIRSVFKGRCRIPT